MPLPRPLPVRRTPATATGRIVHLAVERARRDPTPAPPSPCPQEDRATPPPPATWPLQQAPTPSASAPVSPATGAMVVAAAVVALGLLVLATAALVSVLAFLTLPAHVDPPPHGDGPVDEIAQIEEPDEYVEIPVVPLEAPRHEAPRELREHPAVKEEAVAVPPEAAVGAVRVALAADAPRFRSMEIGCTDHGYRERAPFVDGVATLPDVPKEKCTLTFQGGPPGKATVSGGDSVTCSFAGTQAVCR